MARGYDDFALPVQDFTLNRKWVIYGAIGISVLVLAMLIIPILPKSLDDKISDLYDDGQDYIDDGNLSHAQLTYSQIIELKPNEEKAWHEKGKILVRADSCSEANAHYEKYVRLFPESTRGAEGYELAKLCM